MSKTDKLLQRFLSKPKDFTYEELWKVLKNYGYEEIKTGKLPVPLPVVKLALKK